jgi:hypothetical protein
MREKDKDHGEYLVIQGDEMSTTIDAEYDGTVFIPICQVHLKKHGKYRLIIEEESDPADNLTAWDILREHAGTIEGPEDWSENLDHYLYPILSVSSGCH